MSLTQQAGIVETVMRYSLPLLVYLILSIDWDLSLADAKLVLLLA
jgi:hypothetical protein